MRVSVIDHDDVDGIDRDSKGIDWINHKSIHWTMMLSVGSIMMMITRYDPSKLYLYHHD